MPDERTTYLKIDIWSKPLKRHSYSQDDISWSDKRTRHEGSGLLLDMMQEKSGLEKDLKALESLDYLVSVPSDLPREKKSTNTNAELFRRLETRKTHKKFTIYDYSEVELGEREKIIDELINKDHYYDEVRPIDADEEFTKRGRTANSRVFVVLSLLALITVMMVLYFRSLF